MIIAIIFNGIMSNFKTVYIQKWPFFHKKKNNEINKTILSHYASNVRRKKEKITI